MTIQTAFDEAAACGLYDLTAEELARRFAGNPPLGHWFAYGDHGEPTGVAVATERADGRIFVVHRLGVEAAFGPLLERALADVAGTVNVNVGAGQVDRRRDVEALGLTLELTGVGYDVPFTPLLERLPELRGDGRFEIVPVIDVDPDELFDLDTGLRGAVPGNDGWRGNRAWFDDEMSSPEFDPSGYHVAIDAEGRLVGLCRMWRNDDGPALGMLGVRRGWRTGFVALELLRATVAGSSGWGWPTFSTHTARPGLQRRLERVGATRSGGFLRFVRQ
ncbi:MAG: hypothetical protein AAFP84_16645 [Actinomycetota bacterium]